MSQLGSWTRRLVPDVVKARVERNNRIAAAVKAAQVVIHARAPVAVTPKSWFARVKERVFGR